MTSAVFTAAAVHFHPRSGDRRFWKRRRLKPPGAALPLHLPFIAPAALGFLSGAALVLTRSKIIPHTAEPVAPEAAVDEIGEWLLVTAPTPFNRFVLLRCPSIRFSDDDAADEKFLREGRRFVNLCGGKISPAAREEPTVNYQRVCVGVEDGGVMSLDWPANLELGEERGLDTTVLLVAGTPEGSMDGNVAALVSDAVKCGFFPVVMNPRGCAGSPLTTARIFSAADSGDVATAVKFINKLRPWSTMMVVGWGYGANMLTKYLAEVGENTPLTAAVCIDNPFDLEEASRSIPHHVSLDKKLTAGLVDILQANKELFQGKTKSFGVTQGLSATSVREFDEAISMVSNGFHTIEEFYSKTSTRGLIGNLKVPVLFIQSDDGTVPLFSIPRETIAENTFTSLLLCTHKPSNAIEIGDSAILWCQQFVLEWLSAVELALLKGRHPLLKDVDVTVNPSKGLTFFEDQGLENRLSIGDGHDMNNAFELSSANYRNKFLVESEDWTKPNYSDRYSVNGISNIVVASKIASKVGEISHQNSILDTNLAGGGEENSSETERGEAMQTAEVVINMLDATLPGTLTDDQKIKVLTAVTQGETFLKALQGAVPEDVRGKLTAAVTEIVQTQGLNLNLEGLKGIKLPSIPSEVKLKIQERLTGNAMNGTVGSFGESNKGEDGKEAPHRNESYNESVRQENELKMSSESDLHPPLASLNAANSGISEGGIDVDKDIPLSSSKDAGQYVQTYDSGEACQESSNSENELAEKRKDENANQEAVMQEKIKQTPSDPGEHADAQSMKETIVIQKVEEKQLKSQNERGGLSLNTEGDAISSSSLQSREQQDVLKRESNNDSGGDDKQGTGQSFVGKSEEISPKDPSSTSSAGPPISVSQALDALTVFDDSTQMAVNSVFGVIENMIDQLEKDNGHNYNGKLETDEKSVSSPEKPSSSDSDTIEKRNNALSQQTLREKNAFKESSASSRWDEVNEVSTKSFSGNHNSTSDFSFAILNGHYNQSNRNGKTSIQDMTSSSFLSENAKLSLVDKFPIHIIVSSYSGVPDNVYGKSPTSNDSKETTLDLDSTADLFLEYFPEEGQYRLLDQLGPNVVSIPDNGTGSISNANSSLVEENGGENIIEPSYVILDDDYGNAQNELEMVEPNSGHGKNLKLSTLFGGDAISSVATILLETLKVEVCRRIGTSDISSMLFSDMEKVATAVALSLSKIDAVDFLLEKQSTGKGKDVKFGLENFVEIITSAVHGTTHLRKVIPVGIVVGSILASLREHVSEFLTERDEKLQNRSKYDPPDSLDKTKTSTIVKAPVSAENNETKSMANEKVMVGAAAAALGASALLAHKKAISFSEDSRSLCSSTFTDDDKESMEEENNAGSDGMQNNIVSSLAEKALSVAAPVVPTNSDGEVDQEKLVNMLADLGQKGGMLKFIGKIALLWGGIRGAMSLTDRLISFLHITERPLYQRVLGFSGMVIVLWSPVVVPLLPTLVQNWIAHKSFGIAQYACVAGLYASVVILVALWGKRTRGYEHPLQQYGLDLACSSTIFYYLKGWIGGVALVMSMHLVNLAFGFARFHWPSGGFLPMHGTFSWVKYCGNITFLSLRETSLATFVVAVEELLFRSWLPDEITLDLGYNLAIIISSFAFSLTHRSLFAIPGLFLLSVALFGVKERNQGKIAVPIGLRCGAIAATSVMKVGGFLLYLPTAPQWVTGTYPWQPYEGATCIAFCALMALLFHPPGFFREKK